MSEEGYQSTALKTNPDTSLNADELQRIGCGKTPIQVLYEFGTKVGNLPVYVMEKAEGAAHQPSFIFSVTFRDISCTGQGSSKKAAKHQAAEAVLNILKIDAASGLNADELQRTDLGKTPIQVLYEYGIKVGNLPVYVMEKAEGQPHQPSFIFSVTFGDISCTGQGATKKAAKHQAAEAVLNILKIDAASGCVPGKPDSNGVGAETNHHPNPVGSLQEMALQRGWCPPKYTVSLEAGPPHMKNFTVICRLESLVEKAIGNSKRTAKRVAAEMVMARLQSLSGCSKLRRTPIPSVRFDTVTNSRAERISLLRGNPLSIPNSDYIQTLLELSREQGFEVTYFDIDELTVNGQYQCLAELSTSPVIVCHGTGITCSNAHNDAAHNALQYIKIMANSR